LRVDVFIVSVQPTFKNTLSTSASALECGNDEKPCPRTDECGAL